MMTLNSLTLAITPRRLPHIHYLSGIIIFFYFSSSKWYFFSFGLKRQDRKYKIFCWTSGFILKSNNSNGKILTFEMSSLKKNWYFYSKKLLMFNDCYIHFSNNYANTLGKAWIQSFSSQIWEKSRENWAFEPRNVNRSMRRKTLILNVFTEPHQHEQDVTQDQFLYQVWIQNFLLCKLLCQS